MFELSKKIAKLPQTLQDRLASFAALPVSAKIELRSEVLKFIIMPTMQLRMTALALAYFISRKYRFVSQKTQLEIAGALIGGHLGYYSVEAIKQNSGYIATPLEESLLAALGGLYGTDLILANTGEIDEDTPIVQTYNLYVLLVHLMPVVLRSRYINEFDSLYPLDDEVVTLVNPEVV